MSERGRVEGNCEEEPWLLPKTDKHRGKKKKKEGGSFVGLGTFFYEQSVAKPKVILELHRTKTCCRFNQFVYSTERQVHRGRLVNDMY